MNSTLNGSDEPMCEGRYGGLFRGVSAQAGLFYPEYGSAISAIFICWIGMHMLTFWTHDSALMHVVAATMFVNGWSSLGYHWSNGRVMGHIDKLSMLMAAWLVAGICFDEFTEVWLRGNLYPSKSVFSLRYQKLLRNVLRGGFWCLALTTMWLILAFEVQQRRPGLFEAAFALPLIFSLAVGVFTMQPKWRPSLSGAVELRARRRFFVGSGVAAVGVTCWVISESLCDTVTFFRWFPGHVIWHISMSWGLMHTLIWGSMLRANNFGATPEPSVLSLSPTLSHAHAPRSSVLPLHHSISRIHAPRISPSPCCRCHCKICRS